MYMSMVGQNLKKARIQAGLTQKEVESRLSLRELSLKDYETGRLKLPVEMAAKFAELFRIDLNGLLSSETKVSPIQSSELGQIGQLFYRGDMGLIFLDPVIRAHLEEHSDKVFNHSVFELLTLSLREKQKKSISIEILKILGSLMGADSKITESEMAFIRNLTLDFELKEQVKSISRSFTHKHHPDVTLFQGTPALKHFTIWMMFFLAKSDGKISHEEITFIEEYAELLKVNRSNFIWIKNYFKRWL